MIESPPADSLWAQAIPTPHNSTPTSRLGAAFIGPATAGLRGLVLEALAEHRDGLTREELSDIVTRKRGKTTTMGTICGRVGELMDVGLVCGSGRTRVGPAGVRNEVVVRTDP